FTIEETLFGTITTGINFDKYEDITVKMSGRTPPQSIDTFKNLILLDIVKENIVLCNYTKPTPIQKCAIPCILNYRDVMACAETGSGKTAAFLVPIINRML
ncbi:DEAD/DEAH box helicase, partial [Salmonella sp. s54836]|uniref:DEAD/DEAH box helicase n=1 Tax=Salmonella sp. s54836 TaxID=3159673 RepID=UPI00397EA839